MISQLPAELGAVSSAPEASSPRDWHHVPCWLCVVGVRRLEIPPAEQFIVEG